MKSSYVGKELERETLFKEIWSEPMTTVAKRYGLSDNGLRKRCVKLQIPLPPMGYWAKLQAGKAVVQKPELPPLQIQPNHALYASPTSKLIDFIDFEKLTNEQLGELEPLHLLTQESKKRFLSWCEQIETPRRIENFNTLILAYQTEMAYRKLRDEEHRFRDLVWPSSLIQTKTLYRSNKAILPISVSEKSINRALRLVNTLITLVKDLDGDAIVNAGESDNAVFRLFDSNFAFKMHEKQIKRRHLVSSPQSQDATSDFKPMYEKVFSGILAIEFSEIRKKEGLDKTINAFEDEIDNPLEKQLGNIFKALCISASQTHVESIIARREYKIRAKERQYLLDLEEQKFRENQRQEELLALTENLVSNIDQHMEGWFRAQKLKKYINELGILASTMTDESNKELINIYIYMVRKEAQKLELIQEILKEVNTIKGMESDD